MYGTLNHALIRTMGWLVDGTQNCMSNSTSKYVMDCKQSQVMNQLVDCQEGLNNPVAKESAGLMITQTIHHLHSSPRSLHRRGSLPPTRFRVYLVLMG